MDALTIMDEIQRMENEHLGNLPVKIMYVADKGENTCRECLENDGEIFDIDDPELPQLPIHPHCRCKYVSALDPQNDVSEDVERYRIVEALKESGDLEEEIALSLAEQIIDARHENPKLREQNLFLLFNGRYLMSSDGKLLLDAVSGQPVSENIILDQVSIAGGIETIEREFDYSYARQGIINEGGIPVGLYYIGAKEERSAKTSPLSHGAEFFAWGYYAWRLHPDEDTDERGRTNFFIHGGSDFNTRGCIDLQKGDIDFQKYFVSTKLSSIYVYVKYKNERVMMNEKRIRYYTTMPF